MLEIHKVCFRNTRKQHSKLKACNAHCISNKITKLACSTNSFNYETIIKNLSKNLKCPTEILNGEKNKCFYKNRLDNIIYLFLDDVGVLHSD